MVERKPVGCPSPMAGPALPPDLTWFLQHPWELPGKVTWTPDFPSSIAFSLITKFLPLYYSRCSLLIQSHLSLSADFTSRNMQKKLSGRAESQCLSMLWKLLFLGCIIWRFQECQWTLCLGCSSHTLSSYFLQWFPEARFLFFFLAGISCVHVRN